MAYNASLQSGNSYLKNGMFNDNKENRAKALKKADSAMKRYIDGGKKKRVPDYGYKKYYA